MSSHLDKAKAALDAAREEDAGSVRWSDLLHIARIQAEVASAEAQQEIVLELRELRQLAGWMPSAGVR